MSCFAFHMLDRMYAAGASADFYMTTSFVLEPIRFTDGSELPAGEYIWVADGEHFKEICIAAVQPGPRPFHITRLIYDGWFPMTRAVVSPGNWNACTLTKSIGDSIYLEPIVLPQLASGNCKCETHLFRRRYPESRLACDGTDVFDYHLRSAPPPFSCEEAAEPIVWSPLAT